MMSWNITRENQSRMAHRPSVAELVTLRTEVVGALAALATPLPPPPEPKGLGVAKIELDKATYVATATVDVRLTLRDVVVARGAPSLTAYLRHRFAADRIVSTGCALRRAVAGDCAGSCSRVPSR